MEWMSKEDNINIKLEVCKDKISGKLLITAHFNSKAPNIFEQKDGTFWMPTVEEKNLIQDAFQLLPTDAYKNLSDSNKIDTDTTQTEYNKDSITQEYNKTPSYDNYSDDNVKTDDLPQYDKTNEPDITETDNEQIKKDDDKEKIDKKVDDAIKKTDKKTSNDIYDKEQESEKLFGDEGLIVEADSDAIEAALKKHSDRDKTIVEADEQTIIDKVLSQKKKGKWSKR